VADLPLLDRDFYYPYNSKGLEIYSICLDKGEDKILSTIMPLSLSYRVLVDREGTAARAYKVIGVPLNLIIDKGGIIRYRGIGYDPSSMRELVEQLL
jgi:hypothetical protein